MLLIKFLAGGLVVLGFAMIGVLAWSLCHTAARADRQSARQVDEARRRGLL